MSKTADALPPDLTIHARRGRGVRRVQLHVDPDTADDGIDWLGRLLPTVRALDALTRRP